VDSLFKSVEGRAVPSLPNRFGPDRAEFEIPKATQQSLVSRLWALIASVAVVTVMLLGGLAAIPTGTSASTPSGHEATNSAATAAPSSEPTTIATERAPASHPLADSRVSAATSSLNQGAGPARGMNADCSVTVGGMAVCGGPPSPGALSTGTAAAGTPVASDPPAGPHWYNVTANLTAHSSGNVPAVEFSGRMAYDPLLSEVVLFVGCGSTSCYENQTWVYNGTSWTNLTGTFTPAPSGRQGAGVAYDPSFGGVVLFGGENSIGQLLNDTWVFTATGWKNVTATVGHPVDVYGNPVSWAYGGMAWDPALGTMVIVDGCSASNCIEAWGQTWFLNTTGWTAAWGPATLTNLTYLEYSSLAYDAADGYLLSYGGYDFYEHTSSNDTFTMSSWGIWVNITNHDAGCVASVCYTPPARDSAGLTWDGQLNAILLVNGFNDTTTTWLNDSWTFSGGHWLPTVLSSVEAPATYCGTAEPALAEMSDNVAPFIIGGASLRGAACWSNEWVYEFPPQATLTVAPHPIDLGTAVTYTAGWVTDTGTGIVAGWNVSYGNGHYTSLRVAAGQNSSTAYGKAFPYAYSATGTFTANATWTDFFYIHANSPTVSQVVYPALVATIKTSATTITAGGTVTFSTAPTGGSGTYTYAWSFGDGTTSTAEGPPAHTYAKSGTYVVNLTVTDTAGGSVKDSVTITVNAASSGLSSTDTYLIIGGVVVVLAVIAALLLMRRRKKPSPAQPWQSGTPPAGAGAPPPGAGAEVPPGVGGSPPPPPPPS
jgi:PKD repeat protein